MVPALVLGLGLSLYLFVQEREARRRAVAAEKEQQRLRLAAEEGARIGQRLTQAGLLISREQYDEADKLLAVLQTATPGTMPGSKAERGYDASIGSRAVDRKRHRKPCIERQRHL